MPSDPLDLTPLDLTPLDLADLTAADWLADHLDHDYRGLVTDLVPAVYDAYVRILHRPDQGRPHDPDAPLDHREPATWAEVARMRGTTLHAAAAWHQLATGDDPEPDSSLDQVTLPQVVDVLRRHTGTPQRCYLALWVGFGGSPRSWEAAATFELPHREYWLFEAPLDQVVAASVEFEHAGTLGADASRFTLLGTRRRADADDVRRFAEAWRATGTLQSPTLWWPEDHAWVVASEIDVDSTVVGCSRAAADDLLAAPGLETFEVEATTCLLDDGDVTNPPAPR